MRAPVPPCDPGAIAAQLEAAHGTAEMRALSDQHAAASPDLAASILVEAERFAERWLVPLNENSDRLGCRLEEGRVRTAPGHRSAWEAFVAAGWTTLDHPTAWGGQGLPLAVTIGVQEVFDRACPAFGMMPVAQRSAARLIAAHAAPALQEAWLRPLVDGAWAATICVSEAGAGSDLARIRTLAEPGPGGAWAITGEKCWISFGDHDLSPRIGHCLLARTPGAAAGHAGLSLFLVPDTLANGTRNGVFVRRLEDKLGLHGSPTCAMGFEAAEGCLIGVEGRGLAQMFVMITNMRLSVGAQGLGIAAGVTDVAARYAQSRRQGGPLAGPVPIAEHADIQRQLSAAAARVRTLRGLLFAAANQAEIAAHHADAAIRAEAQALTQWLLPIVKTTGGEFAIEAADHAMQVLGGAGYTRDWPVEQSVRDARVLTIYEGTTGMQALDLVKRRLLHDEARGLAAFLRVAQPLAAHCPPLAGCLKALEQGAAVLRGAADDRQVEASATAFLHLASLAATGWIAAQIGSAGEHWLWDLEPRAALLAAQIAGGETRAVYRCGSMPTR